LKVFQFDAFASREPVPTSLANAMSMIECCIAFEERKLAARADGLNDGG